MPQMKKVIIAGAGGHGKVIADAILKENKYQLAGFADDNKETGTEIYQGYKVVVGMNPGEIGQYADCFIVAIGNNEVRKKIYGDLSRIMEPVTIIHPSAQIAGDFISGKGNVILAGAVINSSVRMENNCIVNSLALIDHDAVIESHVHIGQAALIGSGNKIAEGSWVRQGENVKSVYYKE